MMICNTNHCSVGGIRRLSLMCRTHIWYELVLLTVAGTALPLPHPPPPAGIETTADTAAELGPDTVQRIVDHLGSRR
jgi:hypothetical protein